MHKFSSKTIFFTFALMWSKYYYFRDADDDNKISNDGTDDRQWSVPADHTYAVTVNDIAKTISIVSTDNPPTAINSVEMSDAEAAPVYYNLQGQQVANPVKGLYIVKIGNKVRKVLK